MTKGEIAKLIYVVKAAYPQPFARYTGQDLDNMIAAWQMVLEDYSYSVASEGLKVYLSSDTKGFPPSPGQVIDCITKIPTPPQEDITADEAWGYVYKAVCNSLYNATSEFDKLPDVCKKVVLSPANLREMAEMSLDDIHTVEKSHFMRGFRAAEERRKEDAKIPSSVKKLIGIATAERTALEAKA